MFVFVAMQNIFLLHLEHIILQKNIVTKVHPSLPIPEHNIAQMYSFYSILTTAKIYLKRRRRKKLLYL